MLAYAINQYDFARTLQICILNKKSCQVENHVIRKRSSEVYKNEIRDQNTSTYLHELVSAK